MNLYDLSGEIADLYRRVKDGVVRVLQTRDEGEISTEASGTLWIRDNIVLTVSHPFDDLDRISVIHGNDHSVPARVRGWDNRYDLAVLEVESTAISAWKQWSELEELNPGVLVLALGYAEIRPGMVSRIAEEWTNRWGGILKPRVEVDGTLTATQAGGPLVDVTGRFLGINSTVPGPTGQTVGYGQLQNLVNDILRRGNPRAAYFGVRTAPAETRTGRTGVVITHVDKNSPADVAGLRTGDVLTDLAGTALTHPHRLFMTLRTMSPGDTVSLTIERGDEVVTRSVTLSEPPSR